MNRTGRFADLTFSSLLSLGSLLASESAATGSGPPLNVEPAGAGGFSIVANRLDNSGAPPSDNGVGAPVHENAAGPEADPRANRKQRATRTSAAVIAAGAAAGAAAGGALIKDREKGALIGAAVGGVAGLIYYRMTQKSPGSF